MKFFPTKVPFNAQQIKDLCKRASTGKNAGYLANAILQTAFGELIFQNSPPSEPPAPLFKHPPAPHLSPGKIRP